MPTRSSKSSIHRKLIDRLDLSSVAEISPEQLSGSSRPSWKASSPPRGFRSHGQSESGWSSRSSTRPLGLDPGAAAPGSRYLRHHGQRRGNVYIEKHGKLHKTEVAFKDDDHLMTIIERIVSKVGRRVDESTPWSTPACRRLPRQRHHPPLRWTDRRSPSGASASTRCGWRTWSPTNH